VRVGSKSCLRCGLNPQNYHDIYWLCRGCSNECRDGNERFLSDIPLETDVSDFWEGLLCRTDSFVLVKKDSEPNPQDLWIGLDKIAALILSESVPMVSIDLDGGDSDFRYFIGLGNVKYFRPMADVVTYMEYFFFAAIYIHYAMNRYLTPLEFLRRMAFLRSLPFDSEDVTTMIAVKIVTIFAQYIAKGVYHTSVSAIVVTGFWHCRHLWNADWWVVDRPIQMCRDEDDLCDALYDVVTVPIEADIQRHLCIQILDAMNDSGVERNFSDPDSVVEACYSIATSLKPLPITTAFGQYVRPVSDMGYLTALAEVAEKTVGSVIHIFLVEGPDDRRDVLYDPMSEDVEDRVIFL